MSTERERKLDATSRELFDEQHLDTVPGRTVTPRQYLGSKIDGERAVRDLRQGRRATYFIGLPFRWVRIPRKEVPDA